MTRQKSVILDVLEAGTSQTTHIFNELKKKYPDIKRSTVRGRLSELRRKNLVIKSKQGYYKLRTVK